MLVLYLDLLSPKRHLRLDKNLIATLASICPTDVACMDGFIEPEFLSRTAGRYYPLPSTFYGRSSRAGYRYQQWELLRWIHRSVPLSRYDLVLVASYEGISFSLGWPSNTKPRVAVLNHNNLDELDNRLKAAFYRHIPEQVEHIVFERLFASRLKNVGGPRRQVWVLHHPIDYDLAEEYRKLPDECKGKGGTTVFAPGLSNDEAMVRQLIELDKNGLLNVDARIVIRSKHLGYESPNLWVRCDDLSASAYLSLMGSCECVFLPYPLSFGYRVSGVFFDSLGLGKRFVGSSIPLFRDYGERYPGLGEVFERIDEISDVFGRVLKDPRLSKAVNSVRSDLPLGLARYELEKILAGTASQTGRD